MMDVDSLFSCSFPYALQIYKVKKVGLTLTHFTFSSEQGGMKGQGTTITPDLNIFDSGFDLGASP